MTCYTSHFRRQTSHIPYNTFYEDEDEEEVDKDDNDNNDNNNNKDTGNKNKDNPKDRKEDNHKDNGRQKKIYFFLSLLLSAHTQEVELDFSQEVCGAKYQM